MSKVEDLRADVDDACRRFSDIDEHCKDLSRRLAEVGSMVDDGIRQKSQILALQQQIDSLEAENQELRDMVTSLIGAARGASSDAQLDDRVAAIEDGLSTLVANSGDHPCEPVAVSEPEMQPFEELAESIDSAPAIDIQTYQAADDEDVDGYDDPIVEDGDHESLQPGGTAFSKIRKHIGRTR